MGVSCGTYKQYASPVRCCSTPKLSAGQDVVKFTSYGEFNSQFDLKVLDFLGGLDSVGVLHCGLVRTCKIAFFIILPVFSCATVHVQVILLRSPDTL